MTITARKYALFKGIKPGAGALAGLYILEMATILSWTFFLDTIFNYLSGSWFTLLPISYILSVSMLAWMEKSEKRRNNPLEALGLAEISIQGTRPSEWKTLTRLICTPPLLILFCIGLIPVPGTGMTLLQNISRTKIVPLNTDMDPRPDSEIFRSRRRSLMKVVAYVMISLLVASIIILVPPEMKRVQNTGSITVVDQLPEHERELLSGYLQMKSIYPDCLEVHVRLASLYYRNDMEEDLARELAYIRTKDPDHAILLLGENLSVDMNDLIIDRDTSFADSIDITDRTGTTQEADSQAHETSQTPADTTIDLRLVASDSTTAPAADTTTADTAASPLPPPPDTTAEIQPSVDTVEVQPDQNIIIEDSDTLSETSSGDSIQVPPSVPADTSETTLSTQESPDGSTQVQETEGNQPQEEVQTQPEGP